MARNAPVTNDDEPKKTPKDVNRGTQDEMEILALIVTENPHLRQSVMEKLKQLKTRQAKKTLGASPEIDAKSGKT